MSAPSEFFGALGDLHADFASVRRIMGRHPEIPFWLCVGDVGDDRGVYEPVPAPFYWIKGNNEDFDVIFSSCAWGPTPTRSRSGAPLRGASLRPLARAAGASVATIDNLFYIPNGVLVEIDGLRVAGLGGTFAPTWYDKEASELPAGKKVPGTFSRKPSRREKVPGTFFRDDKRRHFVRAEVEAIKKMTRLDVLLTHEAPRPFRVGRLDAGKTPINEVLAAAKPRLHLFGHHHRAAAGAVSGVPSICLDLVSRSYLLIERRSLAWRRLQS